MGKKSEHKCVYCEMYIYIYTIKKTFNIDGIILNSIWICKYSANSLKKFKVKKKNPKQIKLTRLNFNPNLVDKNSQELRKFSPRKLREC